MAEATPVATRVYANDLYRKLADMEDFDAPIVKAIKELQANSGKVLFDLDDLTIKNSLTVYKRLLISASGDYNEEEGGEFYDLAGSVKSWHDALGSKQDVLTSKDGEIEFSTGYEGENATREFKHYISLTRGVETEAGNVATGSSKLITSGCVADAIANIDLPKVATSDTAGLVKVGSGLHVLADGTLSVTPSETVPLTSVKVGEDAVNVEKGVATVPLADVNTFGCIKVGSGLVVEKGVVSSDGEKNVLTGVRVADSDLIPNQDRVVIIPEASDTTKGVVRVGDGLKVSGGVVSLDSERFATKTDISDMATKTDISDMATKDDISDMATKTDISDMATKTYVDEVLGSINEALVNILEG